MIAPGVSTARTGDGAGDVRLTGYSLGAGVGYRYGWFSAVGAYVGVAMLDGTDLQARSVRLVPIDILGLVHLDGRGRFWGDLILGLHLDHIAAATTQWRAGTLYGLQGGIDLATFGTHRIGIGLRWDTTTRSATEYSSLSLGLVYRR